MPAAVYKVRWFEAGTGVAQVALASMLEAPDDSATPALDDESIVTGDVSVDRTIEPKIAAEDEAAGGENPRSSESAGEL